MGKNKTIRSKKKKNVTLNQIKGRKGWLFVSPFVIGFVFLMLSIYIDSFRYSLNSLRMLQGKLEIIYEGLNNYRYALTVHPTYVRTVVDSIMTMLLDIPTIIIFSLFIATILNQKMRGKALFRAIFFIPVIMATGIIERAQFNNMMMNTMRDLSGIETGGRGDTLAADIIGIMSIQVFLQNMNIGPQFTQFILNLAENIYYIITKSGVQMLIFLAGLQSISPSIYESANIEGATGWESFWKITLPMVSPMIFVNTIYTIIESFSSPLNPIMEMIYSIGFLQSEFGISSAMAWIYFGVIALFTIIISLVVYKFTFYQQRD